jgi:hypothetical protein
MDWGITWRVWVMVFVSLCCFLSSINVLRPHACSLGVLVSLGVAGLPIEPLLVNSGARRARFHECI